MARPRTCIKLLIAFALALYLFFQCLRGSPALKLKIAVDLLGWDGLFHVTKHTLGEAILGQPREYRSRRALHGVFDAMRAVDLEYCVPARRVLDEETLVECHRFLQHLSIAAFRIFYETDLTLPRFEEFSGPRMKVLGDNPDALYYTALLDGNTEYLVRGSKSDCKDEVYFSFTIYESPCVGCFSQKVVADLNDRRLVVDKDGSYEIVISPRERPVGDGRNWMWLNEVHGFPQLITRHYFETTHIPVHLDRHITRPILDIQVINPPPKRRESVRLSDKESAERLKRVEAFIRSHSLEMPQDPAKAPSWFSFSPNVFGPAVLFRNETQGIGAVDIVYSAGPFKFQDSNNEGLLVTGIMPQCVFANIVLWNVFLQTFGYENGRQVSLNRRQMANSFRNPKNLTGPFKILISARKPVYGLPRDVDWIDSEGRKDGTMFWRFLLPDHDVETPQARLIANVDTLSDRDENNDDDEAFEEEAFEEEQLVAAAALAQQE